MSRAIGRLSTRAVEKRLGFVIDPVEVFEYQQQILSLTFPDADPLYRVQRVTAPLLRDPRS